MTWLSTINSRLDSLPRTRVFSLGRELPAFKACGITGYYLALIVLFGGGLLLGRSLIVLAGIALVSGLSFFAYTYLRKWITGHEELVLMEHVWFALACNAATLWALGEPILPYLDVVSVALCPFLAAGRVGCTLVGCCHGNPSSVGITYNEACARDGFERHLVGIRLFPVPAMEALGLVLVGTIGLVALPFAAPGKVFAWYLLAYSIMRFGLEGIRGDHRPHLLGLSQARWMALVELGFALWLEAGTHTSRSAFVYVALGALLALSLVYAWKKDLRSRLLAPSHLREAEELTRSLLEKVRLAPGAIPEARTTSRGLNFAASVGRSPQLLHVSLSLPAARRDLRLLCDVAARAVPNALGETAQFTDSHVLHLLVQAMPSNGRGSPKYPAARTIADLIYGHAVRRLQAAELPAPQPALDTSESPDSPPSRTDPPRAFPARDPDKEPRPWYFAGVDHTPRSG